MPLQMHETRVVDTAEKIYRQLLDHGIEAIIDDRDERAGVKFNDADLIGIPLRVTVGLRGLNAGKVEVKLRSSSESMDAPPDKAPAFIIKNVKKLYDSAQ